MSHTVVARHRELPVRVQAALAVNAIVEHECCDELIVSVLPQLTEALFAAPNPVPTKLALAQLKLCQADVRSPLVELSDEHPLHARMRALLQEIHHDQ